MGIFTCLTSGEQKCGKTKFKAIDYCRNRAYSTNLKIFTRCQDGNPRKAGRIGVGHVLYGAKFNPEFSPPAEDRPTWDSGLKAASFSTPFEIMPRQVSGKLPCKRASPRVACIGWGRRWPTAISIPSRGFGKPKRVAGGSSASSLPSSIILG